MGFLALAGTFSCHSHLLVLALYTTHKIMTRIFISVFAASLICQAPAQSPANPPKQTPAQMAQTYYLKGQAAEKAGNPEAAKQAYLEALKLNPCHANARYSLAQVKLDAASISAKGREAKFGEVIVPEFNLDDASLAEALDFLRTIVEKQSQGKVVPNFVIQDPKNLFATNKIKLRLQSTPARAVMKYLMEISGGKARYDEYAIVITPQ